MFKSLKKVLVGVLASLNEKLSAKSKGFLIH